MEVAAPRAESNSDPPLMLAPAPPPIPPPFGMDKDLGAKNIPRAGLAMQDDVISFGEFKLVIK